MWRKSALYFSDIGERCKIEGKCMLIEKIENITDRLMLTDEVNYSNVKNKFLMNQGTPIYVINNSNEYVGIISCGAWKIEKRLLKNVNTTLSDLSFSSK